MGKQIFQLLIFFCALLMIICCARSTECELPSDSGPCRAMFFFYYFNPSTNRCEEFVYGGCGGNENRFKTEQECLAKCGNKNLNNEIIQENE